MAEYPTRPPIGSVTNTDSGLNAGASSPSVRAQTQFQDQLAEEYTIDTPENVSFGYAVAGIGSRFIATLIDSFILGVLLIGLNIVIAVALAALSENASSFDQNLGSPEDNWVAGLLIAIYALLNFAIWWGYYMLFEWIWHGQTIGKRTARIRVVRVDGAPLSFVPVAVRNLVRIIDFMPFGYGVGVVTMFCNSQSRRLGDFAAGTLVVKDEGDVTIEALMAAVPTAAPTRLRTEAPATPETFENISSDLAPDQDWSGIRRLAPADYALVQETLARYRSKSLDKALLGRVAAAIATKLEQIPSSYVETIQRTATNQASADEQVAFLTAVAAAYGRWVR
jgi:uncharacterized RDD family membrane protein YckC